MSLGLLLFFLFVLVANVAIGYIIAILLGIGPPDFSTAWTRTKLSVVGRFKKHSPSASNESTLATIPAVSPTVTPVEESAATPPVSQAIPVNTEQPKPSP